MSPAAAPTPPLPQAPPPPPNPPMFGGQGGAKAKPKTGTSLGFGGTILGQGNPTNLGQKTLLGQ